MCICVYAIFMLLQQIESAVGLPQLCSPRNDFCSTVVIVGVFRVVVTHLLLWLLFRLRRFVRYFWLIVLLVLAVRRQSGKRHLSGSGDRRFHLYRRPIIETKNKNNNINKKNHLTLTTRQRDHFITIHYSKYELNVKTVQNKKTGADRRIIDKENLAENGQCYVYDENAILCI